MPKVLTRSSKSGLVQSSAAVIDKYTIIPVLACVYAEIIQPLLAYMSSTPLTGTGMSIAQRLEAITAPRPENKIFWPALAAIALIMVARNWSKISIPLHIKWLFAYLALAAVSVLWAFKPEMSLTRFVLQAAIVTSITLPALLASQKADMILGLFLCFTVAVILNVPFVFNQTPNMVENESIGYPGYFSFKGILGECSAIALLLCLYQMTYKGWRRTLAILVAGLSVYMMILSQSKGSLGLSLLSPMLAGIVLAITRRTRTFPEFVLLPLVLAYWVVSTVIGDVINRFSYYVYGNYTLSGRTVIWDFIDIEIARRPFLGWGYQSFWLVGMDAPSVTDAPGWVKTMPSSHNGYLDIMVDTGYFGLAIFLMFIFTTLHVIGRSAKQEPARAWFLLSLALYVILQNFLETSWMHGMDMLWLIFLVVVAEAGRERQPVRRLVPQPAFRSRVQGRVVADRRRASPQAWSAPEPFARLEDGQP
ncbi:MAG: O-antigen ligase family protein [Bradyrhizobium sp.]|uniref:O-antigen ligase family protein n=1 Tax=Bradyrhizobium sp. TaxID=376 RepID=UPI001D25ADC5|nr:O-antigen ligase family protein [Bradyrhizobium sp.]MBV9559060.1 O-antigen ligase family protein [Bradyrhizobium sp.]